MLHPCFLQPEFIKQQQEHNIEGAMVGALLVTPEQRRSINPQGSNPHNSHNIYRQTPQKPSREDLEEEETKSQIELATPAD